MLHISDFFTYWKPYIAFGKITVVQGDLGNGKTTLALAIAALVSKRRKMPTGDAPTFIGNVIYQSGEDNPQDTLKPRLVACGAECSKIAFIEQDGELTPAMLEKAINDTNSKLVVLDPLQAFLTGKQDINRTKDVRPILRELGNVASRTGAAIIIIGHMNKGDKSKSIYRGLGSIDITAVARSVLLVGKRNDDPNTRYLTQIKNNLSAFGKAVSFAINDKGAVKFMGECDVSEVDLLSNTLPRKSKLELAKEVITTMLADGDKKSNEIYDACVNAGISSSTMQTMKKKLGIKSVHKIDDWYWTLNLDAKDADGFNFPCNDLTETELMENCEQNDELNDADEITGTFLDASKHASKFASKLDAITLPQKETAHSTKITMQSPFGELTLIDWAGCVSYETLLPHATGRAEV